MEDYVLVKYSGNWADEIDVDGFFTTTRKYYDELISRAREYFKNNTSNAYTYYVGTNEEIIYENIEDVLNSFSVTSITEEQYKTLWELFAVYKNDKNHNVGFGFTGPEFD